MTITAVKPVTPHEKLGEAQKLFDQARAILTDKVPDGENKTRAATAEEKNQVEALMEDAKRLKAEGMQLKEIESEGGAVAAALDAADDSHVEGDDITQAQQGRQTKAQKNGKGGEDEGPDEFKNWSQFLSAVFSAQHNPVPFIDPRLQYIKSEDKGTVGAVERKDLSESTGAAGGFLVPVQFQEQLLSVMGEQTFVRPRATRIPMMRRSVRIPALDQTGTTSGQPHWFGGMIAYWQDAATEKSSTEPSFRQIELTAHKLVAYTRADDELLADSVISLEGFLSGPMGFAGALAWMEEYAFLNGSGAGEPLGVINAGATITEGRNTANTVVFDDFADMCEDFLPSARGVWVISQSLMSDIIQLNGPTGNPSYIWQANARDGIPGQILGMPVIWTEKVPVRGSAGDVGLYDWRYYLLGDRQATTVESTKFDRWRFDQTSWRAVHRVDGQPWLSSPITLQDGTTQVSPFVILGSAAGGS